MPRQSLVESPGAGTLVRVTHVMTAVDHASLIIP